MLELSINKLNDLQKVAHALSSDVRLNMINLLNKGNMNIHQLATTLEIPISTAASHVKVLEESGLILTELRPASRGAMKVCTRNFDDIHIQLKGNQGHTSDCQVFNLDMPIGQYVDFDVAPTCGMADEKDYLIPEDEPVHFFNPVRSRAQIIWTRKGYFEYKFPLVIPSSVNVNKVEFSAEICSEAPNHDPNWPSDITVWVNEVDIGTWTSPGDFGDRPGKLNPGYWAEQTSTQYGKLKTWKVTNKEATIDDVHLSDVTVNDLNILVRNYLSLRIGIKEDAIHKGGINLFGKLFGDYEQDIKLKVEFSE
ncbi:ArsR family transcriptional regulator [Virgibacillus phasianinus]|uniref:ArsR family transcriptional regulator n=1 Tax=Virgibacillus phasianinus TaxID=2017483 RepID=A0A220U4A4_9BACI|nr:ArsR family transcriptional regulator [Virgibacillus phasianinus]ASK62822.1 ArsR family transcriptional regulator [Virgibacillus phasianinus]